MIVPFPPGGATDAIARIIQDPLQKALGQPIVMENIGGAGGMIAADKAAHATPDGYTILIHQVALAAGVTLYKDLNFDAVKDFTAVGLVELDRLDLGCARRLPGQRDFDEMLRWMKQPGQIVKIGHAGVGWYSHLAGVLIAEELGVKATQVPYRGAGPALVDLLAGQVDLSSIAAVAATPLIKEGKLKAFAIVGTRRIQACRAKDLRRLGCSKAQRRFLAHAAGADRHATADHRQDQRSAAHRACRSQKVPKISPKPACKNFQPIRRRRKTPPHCSSVRSRCGVT